ncbi:MAG: cadmium-translocating P-type ATPase [Megasphaera sp.]|jgi:Cd2+/Zn2+-exporting ATPase|nr:cadmium-translocating P-type ATPase [Megasphaera sp.]MCH4187890.1 cadmium-translocating P-type ATPase [Megasphaera sp.]MCH4218483.1 cadmium-translocating P-type ATPase [Megasphaera sp.]
MEDEILDKNHHGCSCCHHDTSAEKAEGSFLDTMDEEDEEEGALWQIVVGTAVFLFTYMTDFVPESYSLVAYGIAYLLLGNGVIRNAIENIIHKEPFDENLLMVIATGGAFAIGDYPEAVAVMLFSRLGEALEDKAVDKSRRQVKEAVDLRPETIECLMEDGTVKTIPAKEGHIGDIVVVRAGDRIPLDGIVTEGTSRIDTSAVTGEPVPVPCQAGSEVLSGCINMSGTIRLRVTKVLSESMVTKILQSVEQAAAQKPKMDRFITRFSRIYTPGVVAVAVVTAVVPSLVTGNWYYWLYTALTFLVISCPCAIVLSVPLSFFAGIGAASKRGILFKGGIAIEQMKRIGAVVFDKTGTVTKGNFVVQQIVPADGFTEQDVLVYCAAAEQASSHPIAASVVAAAKTRDVNLPDITESDEIAGEGLCATVNGRMIVCGNMKLMNRKQIIVPQQDKVTYGSELYVAVDGIYAGHIVVSDTIKPDAVEAIRRIRSLGITTAMLTGDSQEAADYIAKQTGIEEVRARLLPQDKVRQMDDIRSKYGPVLFVGDGINDAPVLAGADVGAAMGSGADAAVEAADVVFVNSQVSAVPDALHISRGTMAIAVENVVFALGVKAVVMIAGFAGFASMWAAVFADSGVAALCVLNSVRLLYKK